jgi:tetratricopeptide (TPR) repeat protein
MDTSIKTIWRLTAGAALLAARALRVGKRPIVPSFAEGRRKQAYDLRNEKPEINFVRSKHVFVPIRFSVLLSMLCSCGVGGDVAAGRNALQTGRANDAIGYLTQAADADPDYKLPYRVSPGVLAYLGRAYLETGRDTEARQTLERAVKLDKDDPVAHLYLGIALLKTGERERGRKEIEDGLKAIDDTLEYIAEDRVYGFFWDPGMQIRNDIRESLAAKLDAAQLTMAGERIGREFDEEIDKARRDEARRRGGSDSGGGGN